MRTRKDTDIHKDATSQQKSMLYRDTINSATACPYMSTAGPRPEGGYVAPKKMQRVGFEPTRCFTIIRS